MAANDTAAAEPIIRTTGRGSRINLFFATGVGW